MIRRIREMPRLHAETIALLINPAAFARDAVEMIRRVKLHARFGGEHFHHATAPRLEDARRQRQFAGGFVENVVVIVTGAEFDLFVVGVDARADLHRNEVAANC